MTVIKGYFFDLDGTLVDTHEANYHAYKHAVKDVMDIDLGEELKRRIKMGESSEQFLPKLLDTTDDSHFDRIKSRKKELYPDYLHHSKPNDFLISFLRQMAGDFETVLVTTAKRKSGLAVLKAHGLDGYFSHSIFGEDVKRMKPDPEAYLLALKTTGLKPDEVIIFEDSDIGLETADNAGIAAVHIRTFHEFA